MAAYHETALLYNLKDTDIGRQLKLILIKMKVRIRMVEASQYLQPIGFLAGIKDMEGSESVFQETVSPSRCSFCTALATPGWIFFCSVCAGKKSAFL